jgi:hypothetical protein
LNVTPTYVVAVIAAAGQIIAAGVGIIAQVAGDDDSPTIQDGQCLSELRQLASLVEEHPAAARLIADGSVELAAADGCPSPVIVVTALLSEG